MAKDQANAPTVAPTDELPKFEKEFDARTKDTDSVDGLQFESPVPTQENVGEVSNEKAKEINGYKGHDNIASKVEEDQEAKGRKRDDETSTGAKFF